MKKIILICVLLFTSSYLQAQQIIGTYCYKENNKISFYFSFQKNGKYLLELVEIGTSDIIVSRELSYGVFTTNKSEMTLIDKMHKYKIVLTPKGKELILKKSFSGLKNKRFFFDSASSSEFEYREYISDAFIIQRDRSKFKRLYKFEIPVKCGIYKSSYEANTDFTIYIQSNNKYKLEYEKVILSEGTWRQKGNELVLRDSILKIPFYLLIEKDALLSKFILGGYNVRYHYKK